jgi:TatD DNase family protein
MLVDSHCHLPLMDEDLDDVFTKAAELGVVHMLCVSVDLESLPEILELAGAYKHIYASAGIHPNTELLQEPTVEDLVRIAAPAEFVAIGETGLDYYRSSGDLEWQRDRFRRHIQAAKTVQKPLIIHSRQTHGDTTRILKEEDAATVGGVMHCFVDDWETAKNAMDMNFYISFSGIVTFKNAREVQEVARQVPLDRMLIETDSPYLAPVPYRGKPNQPGYVYYTAKYLAELRGEAFDRFSRQTTENFFNLFSSIK